MSLNRENVIWQSADGTWNRGFFVVHVHGPDHEWDVDYDMGAFEWVTTGHPTEEAARAAWDGANPGSSDIVAHDEQTAGECATYDRMAQACTNDDTFRRQARRRGRQLWWPPRRAGLW